MIPSSLYLASVMTHILFFDVLTCSQKHVDAVLPDCEMLTGDCVDIGRQLGPHYVEEKLIVLGCLHPHVVVLSVSATSCTIVISGAISCAEVDRL